MLFIIFTVLGYWSYIVLLTQSVRFHSWSHIDGVPKQAIPGKLWPDYSRHAWTCQMMNQCLLSEFQCSYFFIILFFWVFSHKDGYYCNHLHILKLKRSNTAVNRYTRIACRKLFISTLAHTQEYVKHMLHGNNLQVNHIYHQTMSEIWHWLFCYWKIAKTPFIMIIDIVWTLWISLINYQS